MQASAKTVGQILEARGQFIIPFFQRHYSWEHNQWRRLWNDLMRLVDDSAAGNAASVHFLGPLVTIPLAITPGALPTWQVIDGQQRLTTLTLLLASLRDVCRDRGASDAAAEIMDTCLVNTHRTGLDRYKVIARTSDRETLEKIVEGKPTQTPAGNRLVGGVKFFADKIRGLVARNPAVLDSLRVAATTRLSLVTITLEGENPYEIFESLNATGLPLEESDLIRNYLFMQVPLPGQEDFQERHWSKLESAFVDSRGHAGVPTAFYRSYLMRHGWYSKQKQTYLDFRNQFQASGGDAEAAVDDLRRFAGFDGWLRQPQSCPSKPLADRLRQIELLDTSTAHPLILHLLDRQAKGGMSEDAVLGCFDDVVSFVLRRSLCGDSTRPYARWFVEAIRELGGDDPRASLQRYFARRGWPDDDQFVEAVCVFPLYARERRKTLLVLDALERNLNAKEIIVNAGVSIEHVLPQTVGDDDHGAAWKKALGHDWQSTHDRLVDVLGNLTLTAFNSEMKNYEFTTKRQELANSKFLLNKAITAQPQWTAAEIEARSRHLAAKLVHLFSRPSHLPARSGAVASRADRKRVKAKYWEAVIPALRSLEFLGDLPQGRTVGLLGLPLTRKAFRYGLRPRFGKKRLSLLLFVRGPDRARNFDALHAERAAIEEVIGERLVWRPDVPWSKATSLIELESDGLDPNDGTTLDRQKAWFVDALRRFHAAFHDRCLKLAPRDAPRPMTATRQKRRTWWTLVLGEIARKSDLFAGRQPPAETWIGVGSGVRGVPFVLSVTKTRSAAALYIDRGRDGRDENKRIFATLKARRADIEAAFGGALEWAQLDAKRASKIRWVQKAGYDLPEAAWPAAAVAQAEAMIRLDAALRPLLAAFAEGG